MLISVLLSRNSHRLWNRSYSLSGPLNFLIAQSISFGDTFFSLSCFVVPWSAFVRFVGIKSVLSKG